MVVPDILLSGHHKNIEQWRLEESLRRTAYLRSDLLVRDFTAEEVKALQRLLEKSTSQEEQALLERILGQSTFTEEKRN